VTDIEQLEKLCAAYKKIADDTWEKQAEIERLRELFRIDGEQHAARIKEVQHEQDARLTVYKHEIERLRAFVHWALSDGSWRGTSLDGGEIQDKAIELGLVVKTKYDNAIHGESAEAEDGDDWYMLAWSMP